MKRAVQTANAVVGALHGQPLALALIVINVLFLIAGGLFVFYIGNGIKAERQEAAQLLSSLITACIGSPIR